MRHVIAPQRKVGSKFAGMLRQQTEFKTAVVIPTYQPGKNAYKLISSLVKWYPEILIVVVDDCTPVTAKNMQTLGNIKKLLTYHRNLVYLRTPTNKLKAGALNLGIDYIATNYKTVKTVFTSDDDVSINMQTIPFMEKTLYSHKNIGAVCSSVRIINKDQNILTRLQGLEYQSFNVTKIADNSFLRGPMVMQGMFTAFRMQALKDVGGFEEGHLIEDYDMTARLKLKGWMVRISREAYAGTIAPHEISQLWKQRIRWTYGGVSVVMKYWKNIATVFQDLVGHLLFLGLYLLIIASFIIQTDEAAKSELFPLLVAVTIVQLAIGTLFNILILKTYRDADIKDVLIKLSIVPEFIYSNVLSLILIGTYLFYAFSLLMKGGMLVFQQIGYSTSWGTRQLTKKGGVISI